MAEENTNKIRLNPAFVETFLKQKGEALSRFMEGNNFVSLCSGKVEALKNSINQRNAINYLAKAGKTVVVAALSAAVLATATAPTAEAAVNPPVEAVQVQAKAENAAPPSMQVKGGKIILGSVDFDLSDGISGGEAAVMGVVAAHALVGAAVVVAAGKPELAEKAFDKIKSKFSSPSM